MASHSAVVHGLNKLTGGALDTLSNTLPLYKVLGNIGTRIELHGGLWNGNGLAASYAPPGTRTALNQALLVIILLLVGLIDLI